MQPRDAFPFLFFPIVNCLNEVGSMDYNYTKIGEFLKSHMERCEEIAEYAAEKMLGTIPFIYGTSEAVCMRYKTEINENAKMHAKFEVYPEVNHNEIVGWQGKSVGVSVVFLRGLGENEHITKTVDFLRNLIDKKKKARIIQIEAKGSNWLEKAFYLIYIGDLISYFLSEKQGIEREKVEYIEMLKRM
jgi:glucose/mannose-6-phosphate isomerase